MNTKLSKINPRDLIYPGIFLFFIIIVCIVFFLATQFITKSINVAFSGDSENSSSSLNMDNYTLVARKLGIKIADQNITPSIATSSTATTTIPTSPQSIDKKSLTLNVLNSTTKRGIAGILAQNLEAAGFAKATVGNQNKLIPVTTIFIKDSKSSFTQTLLDAVLKLYPTATATTTPESDKFDATIVIGTK